MRLRNSQEETKKHNTREKNVARCLRGAETEQDGRGPLGGAGQCSFPRHRGSSGQGSSGQGSQGQARRAG